MAQKKETKGFTPKIRFHYGFRVIVDGRLVAVFPTSHEARWYARHHRDSVQGIQKCLFDHDGYLVSVQGLMAF